MPGDDVAVVHLRRTGCSCSRRSRHLRAHVRVRVRRSDQGPASLRRLPHGRVWINRSRSALNTGVGWPRTSGGFDRRFRSLRCALGRARRPDDSRPRAQRLRGDADDVRRVPRRLQYHTLAAGSPRRSALVLLLRTPCRGCHAAGSDAPNAETAQAMFFPIVAVLVLRRRHSCREHDAGLAQPFSRNRPSRW